jgi:hypothetical protein
MAVKDISADIKRAIDFTGDAGRAVLRVQADLENLADVVSTWMPHIDIRIGPMQVINCENTPTPISEVEKILAEDALILIADASGAWWMLDSCNSGKWLATALLNSFKRVFIDPAREVYRVRYWVKSSA